MSASLLWLPSAEPSCCWPLFGSYALLLCWLWIWSLKAQTPEKLQEHVAPCCSGPWFRAWLYGYCCVFEGDKHRLLCVFRLLPHLSSFPHVFLRKEKESTGCPRFKLVSAVWSFGTLNFPVVTCLQACLLILILIFSHIVKDSNPERKTCLLWVTS